MQLLTQRELILSVVQRWAYEYENSVDKNKMKILNKLRELNLQKCDAATVNHIIGNTSWLEIICDECEKTVTEAMQLGEKDDHNSRTTTICKNCLQEANKLINES